MRTGKNAQLRIIVPLVFAMGLLVFVAALGQNPLFIGNFVEAAERASPPLETKAISSPFPIDPPVLSLITAGEPNSDGFTQITGAEGAVPPAPTGWRVCALGDGRVGS